MQISSNGLAIDPNAEAEPEPEEEEAAENADAPADGEAAPEGGMGVARQLKDEVFNCPPVLLVVARKEDAWLAAWSRAEASVTHPVDPFTLANTVASLVIAHSVTPA